jgi:hypothetical protein
MLRLALQKVELTGLEATKRTEICLNELSPRWKKNSEPVVAVVLDSRQVKGSPGEEGKGRKKGVLIKEGLTEFTNTHEPYRVRDVCNTSGIFPHRNYGPQKGVLFSFNSPPAPWHLPPPPPPTRFPFLLLDLEIEKSSQIADRYSISLRLSVHALFISQPHPLPVELIRNDTTTQ